MNEHIYSISEITREIKRLLEETIPTLWIQGEVSNLKKHYSGHYYFTLKDDQAQLSAVIWSSRVRLLDFELADGALIQALGNIRLYEKSGRYQLDVIRLQPAGLGQLQQAFERLKQKLADEGLFNTQYKKALPAYPETIGVVTSETGAAVRDIIQVLTRRAPGVMILVRPVKVQGEGAAADISQAIREFNEYGDVDLLIVGRGGGSLEDLWAFNEESVARAIFDSHIPVISAVGHEIDFTIADLVADMRAPTPSAAAEMAVPDQQELRADLFEFHNRIVFLIDNRLKYLNEKIQNLGKSYGLRKPEDMIRQYSVQLDDLIFRLQRSMHYLHEKRSQTMNHLVQRLENLSPKNVLKRGYSITYQQDKIVSGVRQADRAQALITELKDGLIESRILTITLENKNE